MLIGPTTSGCSEMEDAVRTKGAESTEDVPTTASTK